MVSEHLQLPGWELGGFPTGMGSCYFVTSGNKWVSLGSVVQREFISHLAAMHNGHLAKAGHLFLN